MSFRRAKAVSAPIPIASSSAEVQVIAQLPINAATILPPLSRLLRGHGPKSLAGFVSMGTSQPIDSRRDDGEDGIMPVHQTPGHQTTR